MTQDPHNFLHAGCRPADHAISLPVLSELHAQVAHAHDHRVRGEHPQLPADLHDFRKHPAELDRPGYGHSIGWWEKDTLVIDTVGFNYKAWYNGRGRQHTEQLHTTERYTRLDLAGWRTR